MWCPTTQQVVLNFNLTADLTNHILSSLKAQAPSTSKEPPSRQFQLTSQHIIKYFIYEKIGIIKGILSLIIN